MINTAASIPAGERLCESVVGADGAKLLSWAERLHLIRERAHTGTMIIATEWADAHPPTDGWPPARIAGIELNAAGVPQATPTAVAELGVSLRCSTVAAAHLIADSLELRHRLRRLWRLLLTERLSPTRARQVSERTRLLNDATAEFVDRHCAAVAGLVGPDQLDRLITAAIDEHDPERAARIAEQAADARGVWLHDRSDLPGLTDLSAVLDADDALALDQRLDRDAEELGEAFIDHTHQSRRAVALGDLARGQSPLCFDTSPGGDGAMASDDGRPGSQRRPAQPVTLYLHLSEDAVTGSHEAGPDGPGAAHHRPWGRIQQTDHHLPSDLIREWLGDPAVRLTVKPVIDLNQAIETDAYVIPDRIAEHVRLRDSTCVFPWCSRPSTAPGVDLDHIVAYALGGPTSTENLAPLCRRHHRLKTHDGWTYYRDDHDRYVWRSPYGQVVVRDRFGTRIPSRPPPDPLADDHPVRRALGGPPLGPAPPNSPNRAARRYLRTVLRPDGVTRDEPPRDAADAAPPF